VGREAPRARRSEAEDGIPTGTLTNPATAARPSLPGRALCAPILALALVWPAAAAAAPAVNEFTGGVTAGFSAGGTPDGIAAGPDGNLWFTERTNPGRVARITPAGVVTEFTGGVTPGFTVNGQPRGIAAGPDGNLWFAERNSPGRVARITPRKFRILKLNRKIRTRVTVTLRNAAGLTSKASKTIVLKAPRRPA
jgi:sugar lactone lactonase YvrE